MRGVTALLSHGDSGGLAPCQGGDLCGAGGHRPGHPHHPGHAVPHGHQEETLQRPQIPLKVSRTIFAGGRINSQLHNQSTQ